MRDISKKIKTLRTATARAQLKTSPATLELIRQGKAPKGDPLPVARVAALQAAKSTSALIPDCHPLPIDFVGVDFRLDECRIEIVVTVKAIYKTGVEMEALTAAAVAALTLYDMLKPVDKGMEIAGVVLLEKKGGKSDYAERRPASLKTGVVVISDSVAAGRKEDKSGKIIVERMKREGVEVAEYAIVPDETAEIENLLIRLADERGLDLILTTGGTGFSPRDCTPEAMARVVEREIPGIPETARNYGQERTPFAMLSRGKAGIRGRSVIVNLPGSSRGVAESLDALFPSLLHGFHILRGGGHRRGGRKGRKNSR